MLKLTSQTQEEYSSYLWCHGCETAQDHGTIIEASRRDQSREPRWMRLCDSCLESLRKAITPDPKA